MTSAADVAAALKERDEAHRRAAEATRHAREVLRAARAAGVPWRSIQTATGLSRQRLWQLANEIARPS